MNKRKILIVDDDEEMRMVFRLALLKEGYEVQEAGSAESGIRKARELQPDVILLDWGLPGSGPDCESVCRQLSQDPGTRDAKIIVVTARSFGADGEHGGKEEFVERLKSCGAADYLDKRPGIRKILPKIVLKHLA